MLFVLGTELEKQYIFLGGFYNMKTKEFKKKQLRRVHTRILRRRAKKEKQFENIAIIIVALFFAGATILGFNAPFWA